MSLINRSAPASPSQLSHLGSGTVTPDSLSREGSPDAYHVAVETGSGDGIHVAGGHHVGGVQQPPILHRIAHVTTQDALRFSQSAPGSPAGWLIFKG